ncbi:MAG TPA: hypothetical protein PKG95_00310 [Anaerolineaceae bacterium]|jgi:hypothetical protein|nr:hypothetical protein [Anaerolineaceae bacterium]
MTISESPFEKVQLVVLEKITCGLTQLRDWLTVPDAEPGIMNQIRQVIISNLVWLRQKSPVKILAGVGLTALTGFLTGILIFILV